MNKLLNNLLGMYKQAKMKKSAMIIDEILDRKDGASYNPQDFYDYVSQQLDVLNSKDIARALDSGTEEDVKKALCEYIKLGEYNPAICDYINSVNWLEEEDVEKWFSIKLSDEQAKEFAKLLTENNIKNKSKKEGEEIRVSFFLLPSSIGVAQGLLAATLSKFPDKQASTIKRAEEDLIEVGWGLYTNDEYEIEENALYGGGEIKEVNKSFWNKINKDIEKVEMWFLKDGYKQFFAKVRDEGHGKDNELGGTAWMTKQQIQDFIDRAERTDGNRYTIREEIGGINVPFDYDETLFFTLDIIVDEEILDNLNIEAKRVSKNKKLSSKNTKLRKKADYTKEEIEMINKEKEKQIECGEMIWKAKKALYGNKVEECKEVVKQMPENCKLNFVVNVKREGEDKYYKKEINEIFKVIPQSLINEADEILKENPNTLYVSEWYRKSSKAKAVRKQAKNKEIVVTYEGTNGKEYIVKAPNGLYFNEYVDTNTQHSRGAGPFETLEKAKEMFKKHRPSAKEIVVTRKKAVLQESENGLGYVLPNGSVVYPGDEAYLKSEYKANKKMLEEDKKELERLESIIKKYPDINFDKNRDSVKFQIPRVKKGIEYLQLFNETIEDILNAFKNKKMGKQATKKQAEKVLTLKEAIGKDESEFKNMEDIVDYINHLPLNANKSSWTVEGFGGNSIDVENLSNGEKATIKLKKNFNSRYATRQNKLFKSATKKQAEGKKYYAVAESGTNFGSNDNKEDLKEEIRDFVVAHKDNFEKKEKIYLKESDTDKTIEEIIVRDILTPYGSKKWVIVATKKQAKDNEYMSDKEIAQQYDDYKITYLSVNGKNAYHVPNFTVELELPNVDENGKQWLGETMVINGTIFTIDEKGETAFNKNNLDEWKQGNIHYSYVNMDKWLPQEMKSDIVYFVINKIIENVQIQEDGSYQFKENFVYSKKHKTLNKQATIKHENGVYNVYSESGKCLGKGYKTKEEAEKRLKQVEYFKHKNASVIKKAKNLSEIDGDAEFMSDLEIGNGMPYNSDDYDYFEVYKIHAKNPKDTYNNKYVVVSDDGSILAVREKEEDIIEITYDDMLQELRWRRLSNRKTQPNKRTSLKQVVISKMAKIKK